MIGRLRSINPQDFLLPILLLVVLSLLLQIPWSPANHKIHVDGTVFAYGGQRILQGDIPYLDFWDHKPPGVFYLNALAFLIGGADAWSVWYLTLVWTVLIAVLFYRLAVTRMSRLASLMLTGVLLATFLQDQFYQGANLTEFYGLLPAVASLFLLDRYLKQGRSIMLILIGLALVMSFLFKHTNIATPLVAAAVALLAAFRLESQRQRLRSLLHLLAPIAGIFLLIAIYWGLNGGMEELWRATIEYNLHYAGAGLQLRRVYGVLRDVARHPSFSPLLILGLAGLWSLLLSSGKALIGWFKQGGEPDKKLALDLWWLAVYAALLAELAMLALLGGRFGHYFMSLVPAMVLAAGYWLQPAEQVRQRSGEHRSNLSPSSLLAYSGFALWLFVSVGLVRPSYDDLRSFWLDAPVRKPLGTNVGEYVKQVTGLEDEILVWELGAEINFETNRSSPSPFVYYLPLFRDGFHNLEYWRQFNRQLKSNPPELVVIQWQKGYAPEFYVPEGDLDRACRCDGTILEGFTEFSNFVKNNYRRELMFEETFAIYHLDRR